MELKDRIKAFAGLGEELTRFLKIVKSGEIQDYEGKLQEEFNNLNYAINSSFHYNGWFTRENVLLSIEALANSLQEAKLNTWITRYEFRLVDKIENPKKVAVVMAGNIPMVGFHDMLCVLVSGHIFYGKLSSQDKILLPAVCAVLFKIEPRFKPYIQFSEAPFKNQDAVIATGSDNSSRYFDYYFGKYPHIIRKNRNSVAILTGKETHEEIEALGKDIFQYYGLGCRNVSKLMVPLGYDFDHFFKGIFSYSEVERNNKYGNNYDYNKTVYLLGKVQLLENGFLIIKEDKSLSSPQACLFYEYYREESDLADRLIEDREKIQCVVSNQGTPSKLKEKNIGYVEFGKAQSPELWDYADGVDTVEFLIGLIKFK